MDYPNNTINLYKQKYLNFQERMTIQLRLKDGYSPYRIDQELRRASNTIRNEIKRYIIGPLMLALVMPYRLVTFSVMTWFALKQFISILIQERNLDSGK